VGKVAGRKSGATVFEVYVDGRLSRDFVGDVSVTQRDRDVIVAMAVHEGRGMGRDLDLKNAHIFVFESHVMRGLSGDLDFCCGLGKQQWDQQEKKEETLHGREL
jgi:hypothetical protein